MILNIFLAGFIPLIIYNDSLIRKPKYLAIKLFLYFCIPLQALAYTAGTYPDYVDDSYYNTAFRIDSVSQLIWFYLLFLIIRYLKNKIFKKLENNKIENDSSVEYKFIKKVKFLIMIIYGQDKNISNFKDIINLGFHIWMIFIFSGLIIVNLNRFYEWYNFIYM